MGVESQIHDFSHAMPPGSMVEQQYTPIQAHDRFSHNTLRTQSLTGVQALPIRPIKHSNPGEKLGHIA